MGISFDPPDPEPPIPLPPQDQFGMCDTGIVPQEFGQSVAVPGPWSPENQKSCTWWLLNQWEASYKGVPFAVSADKRTGGRRVQVHEFPSREDWENEDLGRLRQQIEVQGYVFGDLSDQWAEQLFAACASPGPAMLYLPVRVPLMAVCLEVESNWNEQQQGRLDFHMTFSVEPYSGQLDVGRTRPRIVSVVMRIHETSTASQLARREARAAFEETFTDTTPTTSRARAANIIRRTGKTLNAAASAARLPVRAAALVNYIAQRMLTESDKLADVQRSSANVLTRTAAVGSQRAASVSYSTPIPRNASLRASTNQVIPAMQGLDEGFGGLLDAALLVLSSSATSPSDLATALSPLTGMAPTVLRVQAASTTGTASVTNEVRLTESVAALVRRLGLSYQILAGLRIAPAQQPHASLTRARLLKLIDVEIANAGSRPALSDQLLRMRRGVVNFVAYYSQGGHGAVRVPQAYTSGVPLAVTAANMYERSAVTGRDADLMKFNGVDHPLFGPTVLDALSDRTMYPL